MPRNRLAALLVAGLLTTGAVACDGDATEEPMDDDMDEPMDDDMDEPMDETEEPMDDDMDEPKDNDMEDDDM